MTLVVTPLLDDVATALRAFLLTIVPTGTEIVAGLDNRVPMPPGAFVNMTVILTRRLRTNQDAYTDPFPSPTPGSRAVEQGTRVDVQLDFYGPSAGDWAVMAETMLRDDAGCDALAPTCQPLYADEAKQIPFVSGEEQYVTRWTLTAVLQYNPVTTVPQQFADAAVVDLINVDEAYPP